MLRWPVLAWLLLPGFWLGVPVSGIEAHPPPQAAASGLPLALAGEVELVLSGTACTAIALQGQALWVGTSGRGVARALGGKLSFWGPGERGLPRGRVLAFASDAQGVWALVDPDRVVRLDGERWVGVAAPPGFVRGIARFRGKLAAATLEGLQILDEGGWVARGARGAVEALAGDGERECWYALEDGRVLGLESGGSVGAGGTPGAASGPVRALLAADGWLLAGRYGSLTPLSLSKETGSASFAPQPVEHPLVSSLGTAGNALLVGTWGSGVMVRTGGGWYSWTRQQGLPSDKVNGVAGTADYVAVATESGAAIGTLRAGALLPTRAATAAAAAPASLLELALEPERLGLRLARPDPLPRELFKSEQAGGELSPLARLGDTLFEDPTVLGPRAQSLGISCGTCHPAGDTNPAFFIPGLSRRPGTVDLSHRFFNAAVENNTSDPVDIPSLRGARLTGPYGHDGRTGSLKEFIRNVIVLEFAGAEPSARDLDALTAYVTEIDFLPNRMLGAGGKIVASAPLPVLRGEQLFRQEHASMGGKSCAGCHDPSAQFTDRQTHDVGSGGAFDTPSLLGSQRTAPYFHDGSKASLGEVVEHFDKTFLLNLTGDQRRDLTAYLEAVGDVDEPWQHAGAVHRRPAGGIRTQAPEGKENP